ncbi:Acyl-CoA desaturase [Phytophthora citrophthora]|uniref:Acyl-CoA desaturase n=1 Tax=Phytophthora citrophthora TaxID=4793 RepID=A0AAD9LPS3_9STRA|nr:Acyl-CoA desaturase [Phytophthora citrophthora]
MRFRKGFNAGGGGWHPSLGHSEISSRLRSSLHGHLAIMMSLSQFKKEANWFMVYYITVVHLGAIEGVRRLFQCRWETYPLFFFIYYLSGLGITMGAHRLWAHRSYKAHGIVRFFLMLCNCLANQGTIFHWSRDHRVHHKYSDTVADPHNSGRGFFFAHMGWLLVKKDPRVLEAGTKLNYDDLWADWTVVLQEKFNPWGQLFMCFVFPTIVGVQAGEEWKNALFILGFLRYVSVLHATWLVNSAAHFYGYQTYDNIPPRENWFVSLWAIGEGWHNWHHKFPYDYATSEFGATAQFNPTKLTIDFMALLGLVTDRKRATEIWAKIKESKDKGSKFQDPNGDDPSKAFSELKAKAN